MSDVDIPEDVLRAIRESAEDIYGSDDGWADKLVALEVAAYQELQRLEFGSARQMREQMINLVCEGNDGWTSRLEKVKAAITAYEQLLSLDLMGLSGDDAVKLKKLGSEQLPFDYSGQLERVQREAARICCEREIRARVGPYLDLLIKMERIIGKECYNKNVQNYGPGGIREGDGRSFRYPVRYLQEGQEIGSWQLDASPDPAVILTGFYKFGANQLGIFRGLLKVIEMIEAECGVDLRNSRSTHQAASRTGEVPH